MVQPRAAIAVGDPILIRFWHFALNAPTADAPISIEVGDHMAWQAEAADRAAAASPARSP